jgi:putative mRNA 3-end processing factor
MILMIEIKFLGGAREVGRLAIQVDTKTEKHLFDYGVDVQDGLIPQKPDKAQNAVFLSHAHLDHCGFIPNLYKSGYSGSVYSTPVSLDLCSLLLKDSLKVQEKRGLTPQFLNHDIKEFERFARGLEYRKRLELGNSVIELYDAGHVPGSASILMESQNKRILYTGDIKFSETKLLRGADTSYRNIDTLICESTYFYKNHPDRKSLTDKLREIAQHTVYNNGILLLPCFAIGRAQEMLLNLHDLGFPIYMDGMCIRATKIILLHKNSVKDGNKLRKAFSKAHKISRSSERKRAIKKPCIIIATSGMLNGGPITYYIKKLHKREDCCMVLSGYQVEGTVGRKLLDTGKYVNEGLDVKPKMPVHFMDLSAHCGRDSLIRFLEKTNPEKVLPVHSDRTEDFAKELKAKGFDAHAPRNGEMVRI